jgi:putative sterol carrier protein
MAGTAKEFFDGLAAGVDAEKLKGINATYQWDITDAGKWNAVINDGDIEVSEGDAEAPGVTITVDEENWLAIVDGSLNAQMAFLTGKLKIAGDMTLAMKLQNITG